MAVLKQKSQAADSPMRQNGRRSFIKKTGVAVSAALATAAAGLSKPAQNSSGGPNHPDRLQESNAVRGLQRTYESYLDQSRYQEIPGLFAEGAEVVFNGGLFKGRDGIRRLYCRHFSSGISGRKIEPAPGFEPDPLQAQDRVEVAADGMTATGRFPYSIQVGTPLPLDSSLVQMARLQGEGIRKWWEGGIQEVSYVRAGSEWKIERLEYRLLSKADYRPGKTSARPIETPAFAKTYPADPDGPDRLI
jgi:hypothetical protein